MKIAQTIGLVAVGALIGFLIAKKKYSATVPSIAPPKDAATK